MLGNIRAGSDSTILSGKSNAINFGFKAKLLKAQVLDKTAKYDLRLFYVLQPPLDHSVNMS